jgi:outer membrane protein TolC
MKVVLFFTSLLSLQSAFGSSQNIESVTSKVSVNNHSVEKSSLKPLSLKDAVAMALADNQSLKTAREKINQYSEIVNLTRSLLYPNLNFSLSGGQAQAALNSTGASSFYGTVYDKYNSTISLQQPLFTFGAFDAIASTDYDKQLRKTDLAIAERTITVQVINSFYNIILNEHLLNNLNKSKETLQKSLETTIHRERIGRAQLLDVLQVKTQIASLQPQIESARNSYETAAAQLASYLGASGKQTEITIQGKLPNLYLKDLEKHMDFKNYYLPEMTANQIQIDQVEKNKNVNAGKYLPSVKLTGNYMYDSNTSADLFSSNSNSWNAAVVLTIPLFEGFASRFDSANYASQVLQFMSTRKDLENTLSLNQIVSRKALETVEISLVSAEETNKLAQESLTEATRQYKLATIDFLQYLTIQTAALTASSSLDQIRYNGITASANYFVASGQPLSTLIDLLTKGD